MSEFEVSYQPMSHRPDLSSLQLRLRDFRHCFAIAELASDEQTRAALEPDDLEGLQGLERRTAIAVLERWLAAFDGLADGGHVALVFELQDEYTSWLLVSRVGDSVTVDAKWVQEICFWHVQLDTATRTALEGELRPLNGMTPLTMPLATLRNDILRSRDALLTGQP